MRLPRASGILLHPTSLPGPFGIGDLGPSATAFLEQLRSAGQRWWQILPLGPTGYGNSPYQSYSSFAGNPLLISPEALAHDGLLSPSDWSSYPSLPVDRVDFDATIAAKDRLLRAAFANFTSEPADFASFVEANAWWLDDYALFMALKQAHGGSAWYDWPVGLLRRDPGSLKSAWEEHAREVRYQQFLQYVFDRQWRALRREAHERRVTILGDLPIFVAVDSADVWSRPDLFWLDQNGRPTVVAGVPPDYFAATGQLWGNPLYRWEVHAAEDFQWWASRIKAQTDRVDLVRLDHFRGFEAYWEVPGDARTAEVGRWVRGPGAAFLESIRARLGTLALVAEDLGDISPEVGVLRDQFELPGMRVLQFGLNGASGADFHLPYTYVPHCLAYTGTHDNDTIQGWFQEPPRGSEEARARHERERALGRRYLDAPDDQLHWAAIRAVSASTADTCITPVQDLLGLGTEGRMNVPGVPNGNWQWRIPAGMIPAAAIERLADLTAVQGRWAGPISPSHDPTRLIQG